MRFRKMISLLIALVMLCAPFAAAEDLCALPLMQDAWYELNDDILTVRLPAEDAQKEAWHFQIGNERVIELLTSEIIGDEAEEYAYASMWVGSFKSFGNHAGRTVIQFTRTDENGSVIETRLLHVSAAEDMSIEVIEAVENSFFHLDESCIFLSVSLPANASTGYSWSYTVSDEDILTCTKEEYFPAAAEGMVGAGGTFEAQFEGTFRKAGHVTLTLSYARPWENTLPVESHEIRLFVNEANLIELVASEPAQDEIGSGYFESDDSSCLKLMKKADGTYAAEISLYRLTTQDDGIGAYKNGVLTFTATDAAGGKMVWTVTREGDAVKAVVTASTWSLLPAGETFLFDKTVSE